MGVAIYAIVEEGRAALSLPGRIAIGEQEEVDPLCPRSCLHLRQGLGDIEDRLQGAKALGDLLRAGAEENGVLVRDTRTMAPVKPEVEGPMMQAGVVSVKGTRRCRQRL